MYGVKFLTLLPQGEMVILVTDRPPSPTHICRFLVNICFSFFVHICRFCPYSVAFKAHFGVISFLLSFICFLILTTWKHLYHSFRSLMLEEWKLRAAFMWRLIQLTMSQFSPHRCMTMWKRIPGANVWKVQSPFCDLKTKYRPASRNECLVTTDWPNKDIN